jgi:UDP-N-acetylglucosamine diphosphorylase / glucose-1-phosphate thymidylyltransferase / UDP-N-acetylgalactosamine diphosphorylase / glucosamine-1-phosphate N-acetyltransferase / galactosamine-1-phosphate N-acetyltransferase
MHNGQSVSVVIPAYNEEATIAAVVADFVSHPAVDEVVVVDNNCRDATARLAREAGARVLTESAPGYGCALRRGLDGAAGDVLVLVEADGSFKALDISKFLAYMAPNTLVLGTRTTRQMVQQGANMRSVLRWGNVIVAKLVEFMWYISSEPRLTDVGCTYRALEKSAWTKLRGGLSETGPAFSPEMMCEVLRRRMRMIEIPVHYFARAGGASKHSASMSKVAKTALMMLRAILRKRLAGPPSD